MNLGVVLPSCQSSNTSPQLGPEFGAKSRLQCAGMNRHEAEDERALRVKTSDLLGPESCADTARDSAKRQSRCRRLGMGHLRDYLDFTARRETGGSARQREESVAGRALSSRPAGGVPGDAACFR